MARINAPVKNKEELEVEIQDLSYQAMGVAKVEGYPLFIENTLPGEVALVKVTKTTKNFGYAKLLELIKKSPDRIESQNRKYMQTGIAPLGHLKYEAQLKFKQKLIQDLLKKAHLDDIEVQATLGQNPPYGYRNKAQVPVRKVNGKLEIGFFKQNSHDFMPLEHFMIQDPRIDEVLLAVRDILRDYHVPAYNEELNTGVIRHILVRRGHYSKEVMVVLVTRLKDLRQGQKIAQLIQATCPDVVSVLQNVNPKRTNVILGQETKLLAGKETITDTLNDLTFEIGAKSFYQVNPTQTEKLYNEAIKRAHLTGEEVVIDAYCGIGTISLNMAKHAKKVYGVEIVPQAIKDAKENAKRNFLAHNTEFELGDAESWMARWQEKGIKPDVIMVDPPRKGLTESLIESAVLMQPQKIVYISCNPATLVRDLGQFKSRGYEVTQPILPVDQFPQTTHVETVVLMSRKDK
ncbi:23S rRNA m(5)U-1939 methyltransferase [Ligilactobacillus sp. WC1T17]|uniref:23S rRNA m(5)U-1939 methyltransferase n=1 Tax=Ligilactobacillus ruminis TaxID=1623 RepID=A0ABY1ADC7_9LACO|nr:23S rRNA m(5)U-1939 methyltransferase [Ligilactobacillus ruminis]